ncbi:ATP-grasp domain-containing protein [Stigmatella erecta]|uniref:ATP-grasp domain-containing protein n=1 Tax=Stigmatella erecta TaxID=83460 RepID=A0A1I0JQN7_9BACT|nr:ATP-grasp domain-containing protein [Stigmatella erecta]SEU12968.1 ATP-grasp domain-containing protein [Stigmatella erecta]
MNFVFISPQFPPHFYLFVQALREQGFKVLGIGDAPYDSLRPELRDALQEYFYTPNLTDTDAMLRAVGYFTWKHGLVHRIESLNESWLAVEATLREHFNVPGLRPPDIARLRTKFGMAQVFRAAGIPHPLCERAVDAPQVKAFAQRAGYPVVIKPDVGVGAVRTFKLSSDAEVDATLIQPLADAVVQNFVKGQIFTYDGFVDPQGRVVFAISHQYLDGIMEVVNEVRDSAFWTLREMPQELEAIGRKTLAALGLRERWFHLEFFRGEDGRFLVLEANLRPPGATMTDTMNYACDVDVYRLWARMLTGETMDGVRIEAHYHAAHITRRHANRHYRLSREELLSRLGENLILFGETPPAYRVNLGDEMYLVRYKRLEELREAISWAHAQVGSEIQGNTN